MELVVLQAIMNIFMSILIFLLIFAYRKKLFMLLVIISPFVLNAILSPLIINNYSIAFIVQLLLIIGYLLIVVMNLREIKSFFNSVINKQIEPTYKGFLKAKARKYQLICFFSFLLSPWILYPVLIYTSFKFYNSFKKPLNSKQIIIFIGYNLIIILAPIFLFTFSLDYNSVLWVLYFCIPELLYPSDMNIDEYDNK